MRGFGDNINPTPSVSPTSSPIVAPGPLTETYSSDTLTLDYPPGWEVEGEELIFLSNIPGANPFMPPAPGQVNIGILSPLAFPGFRGIVFILE